MMNINNFEPQNIKMSKEYLQKKYKYVKKRYISKTIFQKMKKIIKRLF